jgi:hypothetical protein
MAKICPIWSLCCRCELKMAEHCEENSYDLKMGAKIGTSNSNVISDLFTRFCSRVPLRCLCWISPLRFNELVSPIICERIFTKVRYRLGEKIVASYLPLHKFKKYVFIVLSDKNFLCNFRRKICRKYWNWWFFIFLTILLPRWSLKILFARNRFILPVKLLV